MPTDAQWEYSVRAGTATRCYWGDSDWRSHAQEYEWVDVTGTYQSYFEVGTTKSNPWGLYDTLGNAPEWCLDWFADLRGNEVDPEGPNSPGRSPYNGSLYDRVVRTAGVRSILSNLSVYYCRTWNDPADRNSYNSYGYGFRVAVSLTE